MKIRIAIGLLTGTLLLASCAGTKKLSQDKGLTQLNSYSEGELSYKDQFRFKYMYLEAQRQKALGEDLKALAHIKQCLSIDPVNADAHYEAAQLSLRLEKIPEALFHGELSAKLNPNNVWTLQLLSQIYLLNGDQQKEIENYKKMLKLDATNIEFKYALAIAYSQAGEYKKAIQSYNELEKQFGLNEDFSIKKEHLYILLGDLEKAVGELRKLIVSFPAELRYRGMLAELYQANDHEEDALKEYQAILDIQADEPRANIALAEYYRKQNDFEKAFQYLNHSFDDPQFDAQVKFQILVTYFQLANEDESYKIRFESLIKKAQEAHPLEPSFYALEGDLYFQKQESQKSFAAYGKALDYGASEFLIWNRYLILGLELKSNELVYNKGLIAIQKHPIQPTLYLFTGLAGHFLKEDLKAVEVLEKGLNYVVDNRPLKAEFHNYLGDIYHSLKEDDKSDKNYEKSLQIIPDNPMVLNNYSYYLSLRDKDLEEAEKLSKKSNDLSPNEGTYEDTYGWILYKLKRFEEAEEWLKKSLTHGGDSSAVILEHYGDVLYQMAEKTKAKEYWNKALKIGEGTEFLKRKAEEGILYE